jgi:hypothetical protein
MSIEPEVVLLNEVAATAARNGGNYIAAWRTVLHRPRRAVLQAAEVNADARARSFREVGLSATQLGLRKLSEARAIPGTSVQKIRPTPGVAPTGPDPARKPGESLENFRVRLRRQILDLGKRPNTAPSIASDDDSASYSEVKETLMNDAAAKAREVGRNAGRVTPAPSTDALTARAHKLMKAHGQQIDPRSAGFSESFKRALADSA